VRPRVVWLLLFAAGCTATHVVDRTLVPVDRLGTVDRRSPYLKVHLRSGSVAVLSAWTVDTGSRSVSGVGDVLDHNRNVMVRQRPMTLSADSIMLAETNIVRRSAATNFLTAIAVVSGVVTILCLTNPKACFGSCPTIYVQDSAGRPVLQGESFSASIAPALEASDLDAMPLAVARGGELRVRILNEAMETHVIRGLRVVAVPRPPGARIHASRGDSLFPVRAMRPPVACRDRSGGCLRPFTAVDGDEWASPADSTDLASREELDLAFPAIPGQDVGVVVTSRQTLLTTYLLYQGLAWMGSRATGMLASLGRADSATRSRMTGPLRLMGGIEVTVRERDGSWRAAGTVGETGPIATDTKLVRLGRAVSGTVHVKLRLTKGLWRIDRVALGQVGAAVSGELLAPASIQQVAGTGAGSPRRLTADSPLITLPGDAYDVSFPVPDDGIDREFLVEAKGYYLEWMRRDWLAEEDQGRANRLILDPAGTLRDLAPAYKRVEPALDRVFWGSRYVAP
jgi:hypothetical protein